MWFSYSWRFFKSKSNISLARSRALCATAWTSRGPVATAHDAHVLDIANLALVDHAFGHLDLDFVISVGRQRRTEQSRVYATLGSIDCCGKKTGTVFVGGRNVSLRAID